jgi:short-subunit dehydrogenase
MRIVITGAASGIGCEALIRLAAFPGVRVVAADLHADGIPALGAHVLPLACDVSTQAANDVLFDYAKEKLGGIDLFIANAGFAYYELLREPDWARLERIYAVNVFAPLYSAVKMRALYGPSALTVITASAMARLAVPGFAIYGSTKAALHRFAEGYRLEPQQPGRLMVVYPVSTRTRFFESAGIRAAPLLFPNQTPEQVANAIIRGIQRDQTAVYPSLAFRALLIADRVLPLARHVVQAVYLRQFKHWLAD